jgi:hypothetical protein
MANKRFLDFTTDATPSGSNYLLEADAVNGVRKTTIENAVAGTNVVTNMSNKVTNVFYDNAWAHNGIYRGKDLTNYFDSGDMSAAIAAGTFDDIYIGDYIIKTVSTAATTYTNNAGKKVTQPAATYTNAVFRVASINYFIGRGNYSHTTTQRHVVLISEDALQTNVAMDTTGETNGGYLNSDMWKIHMPIWTTAIQNAFGSEHVLKHQEKLSNAIDRTLYPMSGVNSLGRASGSAFTDVYVNIPNEVMLKGTQIYSSSCYDTNECDRKFQLFDYIPMPGNFDTSEFWTRSIASSNAYVLGSGAISSYGSIDSESYIGIRPYFLLK